MSKTRTARKGLSKEAWVYLGTATAALGAIAVALITTLVPTIFGGTPEPDSLVDVDQAQRSLETEPHDEQRWPADVRCNGRSVDREDRSYMLCENGATWSLAASVCRDMNGSLVAIETEPEQTFLWEQVESSGKDWWIGLSRSPATAPLEWTDGSQLGPFQPWWSENETSDDRTLAATVLYHARGGRWNLREPGRAGPFICERVRAPRR